MSFCSIDELNLLAVYSVLFLHGETKATLFAELNLCDNNKCVEARYTGKDTLTLTVYFAA